MADFPFCKMAAIRHLGFLKIRNFNFRSGSGAQYASLRQIVRRSVNPFRIYGGFSIFNMAAVRHLGFLKVLNFNFRSGSEAQFTSMCKISRRSVKLFQRYRRLSIFKMAAVRHLGCLEVGNFNFRSDSEAQYASPCQISRRSIKPFRRYGRFSIFQDCGRPPYWICFTRVGTTHEEYLVVFVTMQNLVVIGAVISIIFCTLSLKMPIHAPKIGFLWDFTPKIGSSINETPKRHIRGRKHVV